MEKPDKSSAVFVGTDHDWKEGDTLQSWSKETATVTKIRNGILYFTPPLKLNADREILPVKVV